MQGMPGLDKSYTKIPVWDECLLFLKIMGEKTQLNEGRAGLLMAGFYAGILTALIYEPLVDVEEVYDEVSEVLRKCDLPIPERETIGEGL